MHTLTHTVFHASGNRIGKPQIVREGFPEAFAYELKVFLRGAVARNADFKALMEQGIPADQVGVPPPPNLDYGLAAQAAFNVIHNVGVDNARSAFFLGAVELVGLAADQRLAPEMAQILGRPAALPERSGALRASLADQETAFASETQVPGFSSPIFDVRTVLRDVAQLQTFRAELQHTYGPFLTWMAANHPQEAPRGPGDEDYALYERARPLIAQYMTHHWIYLARIEDAEPSPVLDAVSALLSKMAQYGSRYQATHDLEGRSSRRLPAMD